MAEPPPGDALDRDRLLRALEAATARHPVPGAGPGAEAGPGRRLYRRLTRVLVRWPGLLIAVTRLAGALSRFRRRRARPRQDAADLRAVLASGLFDPAFHAAQQRRPPRAPEAEAALYLAGRGRHAADPGPDFDTAWYRARNPDCGDENPLLHYLRIGRHRLSATSEAARRRAEATRRVMLGLDQPPPRPPTVIGVAGRAARGQWDRTFHSARVALERTGGGLSADLLGADGTGADPATRIRPPDAPAGPGGGAEVATQPAEPPAAAHDRMLRLAAARGAALYVAAEAGGLFDPGCLDALLRMSAAAGHRALVAATDFPAEQPRAFDPVTFDTGWAGGGCLLVPVAPMVAIGGFAPGLDRLAAVDLSWRARQAGFGVKTCPRALFVPAAAPAPEAPWIDGALLAEGYRLACLWSRPEAAAEIRAEILRHGGTVPAVMPDGLARDPHFADWSHGFGFAPARW